MDETTALLKQLTEAHGVPGYEYGVRAILRDLLGPLGELSGDRMGSLVCRLEGQPNGPRVMLAGHMDEVGFMVKHITKEGFLRFVTLGGWWDQVLLGHRVIVKTRRGDVVGVIGAKPPHLLPPDQRKKVVEKKEMYIDIGATSAGEVEEAGVRVGDAVVPMGEFVELAVPDTYLAKALDDRVGCALLVQVMQALQEGALPNAVYGVATVMEEVGLRGAETAVDVVDPDVAIVLEVDIAGDAPGIKPEESSVKLGAGPSVLLFDRRMIPNLKLRDLVMDTAEERGIPLQTSALEGGGTDGGAIHLHRSGVPTVVLSVPTRHIHSHGAVMHRRDYDQALTLLEAVVRKLDADTVGALTEL
jgi:putative aminopeptidase FrvX